MKKGKILIVALIGLLMAGGLALAGCAIEKCDGGCHYSSSSPKDRKTCADGNCRPFEAWLNDSPGYYSCDCD